MLAQITPVVLTYNECHNISRTLAALGWAKEIVVVDSGSTDGTLDILRGIANVRVFINKFVTHAQQWQYAVTETGITTNWILRLDADYQVSDELIAELSALKPDHIVSAYRIGFDYAIYSEILTNSLYPANTVLLRRERFSIVERGHTEAWEVVGAVVPLRRRIVHDDRKPIGRWVSSQSSYMERELKLLRAGRADLKSWLRLRPPLMPFVAFLYCMVGKGLMFKGRAGMFYALQRTVAEAILSLMVLEDKIRRRSSEKDLSGG